MNAAPANVLQVETRHDAVKVRKQIVSIAKSIGMSAMQESELRTAASELLSNMLRYGGGGQVTVEKIQSEKFAGVRASFVDSGPGIADLEAALTKGFSTGKSLGHGLSGCRNLVDKFELASELGKGTQVIITKWNR